MGADSSRGRVSGDGGRPSDAGLPYVARLTAEHHRYRVTNTVTCDAELTLVKKVNGGEASPADWTLHAAGPTPVAGASGTSEVTGVPVAPGTYELSEDRGPSGYDTSDWSCRGQDGTQVPVHDGAVRLDRRTATTCTLTNTRREEGGWTSEKHSDPPDGSTVEPGSTISYTVTARPTGNTANKVTLSDDLARVLDHARLVPGSVRASAGRAEVDGTRLTWRVPDLTGQETLTHRVRVGPDAYGKLLANRINPGRGGSCRPCGAELTTEPRPGSGFLPKTGSGYLPYAGAAALCVAAGALLLIRRRNRTTGSK